MFGKNFRHYILKLTVEELGDILILSRHDAVNAEIEIGLIQFEEFPQLGL